MEKEVRKYKAGDIIFREGDVEDVMFDICYGLVELYRNYEGKDQVRLGELRGGFFGEYGLGENRARSATAVAGEDTELIVITPDELERYFADNPLKIDLFMQTLSERIRSLDVKYEAALKCLGEYKNCKLNEETPSKDLLKRMDEFRYGS